MDLNNTANRVIGAIVLLLIFIGGWWLIARNTVRTGTPVVSTDTNSTAGNTTNATNTGDTTPLPTPAAPTVEASGEAVEVVDQPAGMTVAVASAKLAEMGWIAVRDNGGRTLGAARLEAGAHAAVTVPLLRGTTEGERYQVLIYVDDGDRAFDLYKDSLVMNASAGVVGATFTAQ
ncbi:MAG: hypothetical protein AAB665_00530 [Patescibacteria group bacterium]